MPALLVFGRQASLVVREVERARRQPRSPARLGLPAVSVAVISGRGERAANGRAPSARAHRTPPDHPGRIATEPSVSLAQAYRPVSDGVEHLVQCGRT